MNKCPACDAAIPVVPGRGRPRKYCNEACRSRYRRANVIPKVLTERDQWVRADGKRPIRVDGGSASSTRRATWSSYADVMASKVGNGFGFMLGRGIGCYDLDDVSVADALAFVSTIPERVLFVERSVSGNGVHVFVEASESPGWKRTIGNLYVERYTMGRFIRMTGDAVRF